MRDKPTTELAITCGSLLRPVQIEALFVQISLFTACLCPVSVCGQGLARPARGVVSPAPEQCALCLGDAGLVRVRAEWPTGQGPPHSGPETFQIYSLRRVQSVPSFLLIYHTNYFEKFFVFKIEYLNFPMKLIRALMPPSHRAGQQV